MNHNNVVEINVKFFSEYKEEGVCQVTDNFEDEHSTNNILLHNMSNVEKMSGLFLHDLYQDWN